LTFDAVVHWGTAVAVLVYFWRDWLALAGAALRSLRERSLVDPEARVAWLLLLGTVPGAALGYLLDDFFEGMFSRPAAAAIFLLVTAALLALSEWLGGQGRDLTSMRWPDGLVIGVAQALAIFPGISRSGATISAGLARGLRREAAARFSFLLSTPIILGAGLLKVIDLVQAGSLATQTPALTVGFVAAAVVGLGCIHFLLRYLRSHRLYPFALYCLSAGLLCLVVLLIRGRV
jgi:undecaprenyl-diphosphatase